MNLSTLCEPFYQIRRSFTDDILGERTTTKTKEKQSDMDLIPTRFLLLKMGLLPLAKMTTRMVRRRTEDPLSKSDQNMKRWMIGTFGTIQEAEVERYPIVDSTTQFNIFYIRNAMPGKETIASAQPPLRPLACFFFFSSLTLVLCEYNFDGQERVICWATSHSKTIPLFNWSGRAPTSGHEL